LDSAEYQGRVFKIEQFAPALIFEIGIIRARLSFGFKSIKDAER
jgi:hypothetical protein